MLHAIKKSIPSTWLDVYHKWLSGLAAFAYGYPSRKLTVIGVTGTNGKTTTAYLIAKALEVGEAKTGCATTAIFKVAEREWLNDTKMTMLGRFALQKLLNQMVKAGCRYAVIETSSQGIVQHRHENLAYDVCVFTNLTPEHIEAHGGFENYKRAKIQLFEFLASLPLKNLDGKPVVRASILNADDPQAKDFAVAGIDSVVWYGRGTDAEVKAENVVTTADGSSFEAVIGPMRIAMRTKLPGEVNVYNVLAALATVFALGVDVREAARLLGEVAAVPGRFERIERGQDWTAIVDYAPEPESFKRLYETLRSLPRHRTIHVLGSCGGGRDVARRPILGKLAAQLADVVIVTNEDPYDDDPRQIMEQVASGAREGGKIEGRDLFLVEDRLEAIRLAMRTAQPGDLVLMTGKGSEQWICVAGGRKLPWDERRAAAQAIDETIAERASK